VRNTRMRCHYLSLYLIPLSYASIYSVYWGP
jgi:hypothetical protein